MSIIFLSDKFGLVASVRNNLQKVTLDNPKFEKKFAIYADNPMDASYIITHSMMERILEIELGTYEKIYISFQNQNVYIAINSIEGFLQPLMINLAKMEQVSTFQSIEKHVDALYLALNLAEDLKLEVTA